MNEMDSSVGGFAGEFRALVEERGITLTSLQRRLSDRGNPVSMATLSYWRSGDRQPEGALSLSAIEDIEDIFGLHRGHLTGLIRPVPRIGRKPEPELKQTFPLNIDQEIEETAQALGTVAQSGIRDLSVSLVGYVDAHGDLERVVTRALVQSMEGTIAEVPLYDLAPFDAPETKSVTEVIGGRVDRSLRHPLGRVVCDVIAFDDPIPVGGTGLIEFTESFPVAYPDRRALWHGVDRPNRQTLLWVRFHPDAVPDWCEEYTVVDEQETVRMRTIASGAIHVARFGFGPGIVGIRWGFDADS